MNGPNIQNHSLMLSEYLHNIQYIDITIPSNSIEGRPRQCGDDMAYFRVYELWLQIGMRQILIPGHSFQSFYFIKYH